MINIDSVYQTVQALANKEQRGYITPQEFNLFANQVQRDIFEQYFYDLNALREQRPQLHVIGDSVTNIMRKIRAVNGVTYTANAPITGGGTTLPDGRVGRIWNNDGSGRKPLRLIDPYQIQDLIASKWHQKGFTDVFYYENGDKLIRVFDGNGQVTSGLSCETILDRPNLVFWGYVVINEEPMYDPQSSADIDLDISEISNVIVKILKLAGISIEDPSLYQAAAAEEQMNIQQENK